MRRVNSVKPSAAKAPGVNSTTFHPRPRAAISRAASALAEKSACPQIAKGGSLTPWRSHSVSIASMRASMNERFIGPTPAAVGFPPCRILPWRSGLARAGSALGFFGPFDALPHERASLLGIAPADDPDPFFGLEILVVSEEMLDLLERDRRQIGVIVHMRVALSELGRRDGEQ